MSKKIYCPHCKETGCSGDECRFKLGRRSFIGLGLGAAASALISLPTPLQTVIYAAVPEDLSYDPLTRLGMLIDAQMDGLGESLKGNAPLFTPEPGWQTRYGPPHEYEAVREAVRKENQHRRLAGVLRKPS